MRWNEKTWVVVLCMLILACTGCARAQESTDQHGSQPDLLGMEDNADATGADFLWDDEYDESEINDPLESLNRVFFTFNDKLYFWVLKPVKKGYSAALPHSFRECLRNFFTNIAFPIRMVNTLLQGRVKDSGVVLERFLINSTLGIYGIADVAQAEFHISPRAADFGQTLGVYGVGAGIYLYLPLMGPLNLRDGVGFVGDSLVHPVVYFGNMSLMEETAYYSLDQVNELSLSPDVYENLLEISLDPYVAARQAYYDYRRNKIEEAKKQQDFL